MLDYYDRCYDHELLQRSRNGLTLLGSHDLGGSSPEQAARMLLEQQLIETL